MPNRETRSSPKLPRAALARARRPPLVVDIDGLPDGAACTTRQVAELSGFSEVTLKIWRRSGGNRGPRVTRIEGRPRYLARDVREWMRSG